MKNKTSIAVLPLLVMLTLAGCASSPDYVAKPSDISVISALHDVGAGLAELKAAEINAFKTNATLNPHGTNDFVTGLFPSEVEVTFNVTRGASQSNQLSLDLSSPPTFPANLKLGDAFTSAATASRGNQITIKLTSALFTTTTTTTTSTNGAKIAVEQKLTDAKTLKDFLGVIKQNGTTEDFK